MNIFDISNIVQQCRFSLNLLRNDEDEIIDKLSGTASILPMCIKSFKIDDVTKDFEIILRIYENYIDFTHIVIQDFQFIELKTYDTTNLEIIRTEKYNVDKIIHIKRQFDYATTAPAEIIIKGKIK